MAYIEADRWNIRLNWMHILVVLFFIAWVAVWQWDSVSSPSDLAIVVTWVCCSLVGLCIMWRPIIEPSSYKTKLIAVSLVVMAPGVMALTILVIFRDEFFPRRSK